ncbi:MAG TPA: DnaJ domain-containing protein [Candidatus Limnocylindrales bacterium]
MTPPGDPYRVLGLPTGASLEEVKRAYRRLAKASHPDSAGPTATARFIALQQAYETLARIAPSGGRRTPPGARPSRRPAPGARPRGAAAGTSRGEPAAGTSRGDPAARNAPPRSSRADAGDEAKVRRRTARHAKLGTTTYDEAELGRPSDWQGASWYGVSSGTYWTINPKEYADPRKHGPEYLARGRRHEVADEGQPDAPLAGESGRAVDGGPGLASTGRRPGLLYRIFGRARGS